MDTISSYLIIDRITDDLEDFELISQDTVSVSSLDVEGVAVITASTSDTDSASSCLEEEADEDYTDDQPEPLTPVSSNNANPISPLTSNFVFGRVITRAIDTNDENKRAAHIANKNKAIQLLGDAQVKMNNGQAQICSGRNHLLQFQRSGSKRNLKSFTYQTEKGNKNIADALRLINSVKSMINKDFEI